MKRTYYTEEHIEFIRSRLWEMLIPDLTRAFNLEFNMNKTKSQIRDVIRSYKLSYGKRYVSFTPEQVEFIEDAYRSHPLSEVTSLFNEYFETRKTVGQLKSFVTNHKILSGRTGQFEKGNKPHNTGTKGIMKANRTSFKKGDKPKNMKPLGSERVCSKDGYILVKVAERNPYNGQPTRYRAKHIVEWEKVHGPVPEGYIIRFKDNDKLNCSPDNLEMVSKRENLYLNQNGYSDLPAELKPTMMAVAKMDVKAFSLAAKAVKESA